MVRTRVTLASRSRRALNTTVAKTTRQSKISSIGNDPTTDAHKHALVHSEPQSNVRGLRDINGDESARSGRDGDSHSDGPEPQEWYTGGASSGQAVIDPRERPEARLASMFSSARAHGAVDGRAEDMNPNEARNGGGGQGAFRGRARTLAGGDEEAETADAEENANDEGIVSRVVTFWQNGFTVDDGPLRGFDDPANMAFMESIARGEAPAELAPASRTQRVNINLVQKHAPYEEPKGPKYTAFGGSGRTLASDSTAAGAPSASDSAAAVASVAEWSVDDTQPTTSIQIRLRDGSRLVGKFNTSHTVAHIRAFIASSRPDDSTAYALQLSGFPPKALDDNAATIAAAGLAGAVVIQR